MPCSFGLLPHRRSASWRPAQRSGRRVTVSARRIPLVTAAYGTQTARPARTTMLAPGGDGSLVLRSRASPPLRRSLAVTLASRLGHARSLSMSHSRLASARRGHRLPSRWRPNASRQGGTMPTPRRLLLLFAALTLSGMMLLAQPASATPPSIETFHDQGSGLIADCGS